MAFNIIYFQHSVLLALSRLFLAFLLVIRHYLNSTINDTVNERCNALHITNTYYSIIREWILSIFCMHCALWLFDAILKFDYQYNSNV